MIRKTLLIITFCLLSYISKAQFMEYVPLPLPNEKPLSKESTVEATIINAYSFNSNNNPIKVKLKIVQSKYGIYIKAFRKLTDVSWLEFGNLPYQASKIYSGSELAKYFEYEVYIPALQKKVYF